MPLLFRLISGFDEDTALRFLLGMAEAGLLPGIIFYLSW
jgi:hypothetical protein